MSCNVETSYVIIHDTIYLLVLCCTEVNFDFISLSMCPTVGDVRVIRAAPGVDQGFYWIDPILPQCSATLYTFGRVDTNHTNNSCRTNTWYYYRERLRPTSHPECILHFAVLGYYCYWPSEVHLQLTVTQRSAAAATSAGQTGWIQFQDAVMIWWWINFLCSHLLLESFGRWTVDIVVLCLAQP